MTTLTKFPLEIVESISSLLRDRHFARLYLTGDSHLQKLLELVRHRTCDVDDVNYASSSALMKRVLIGMAVSVRARMSQLDLPVLQSMNAPRIRRLTIGDGWYRGCLDGPLDFSCLKVLEYLNISNRYVVSTSVVLPDSVTRVKLGAVAHDHPIHQLHTLTNLKNLTIGVFSGDWAERFYRTVEWPPSLTRLCIAMDYSPVRYSRCIPSNLVELVMSIGRETPPVSLNKLIAGQTSLQKVRMIGGTVTINEPLPRTLTSVILSGLQVFGDGTAFKTFGHLPPSVTEFHCNTLNGPLQEFKFLNEDLKAAFELVFPRLTLESAETLIGATHGICTPGPPNLDELRRVTSITHGMRDDYLNSVNFPVWRQRPSQWHIARILAHAESEQIALREINSRRLRLLRRPSGDAFEMGVDYQFNCLRMVELGLCNGLDIPPSGFSNPRLPLSVIHQLTVVRVHALSVDQFRRLVTANELVCLERIDIVTSTRVNEVLGIIHAHRHNLPRLEQVFIDHRWSGPLGELMYEKLSWNTNLVWTPQVNCFVYHVRNAWPPEQMSTLKVFGMCVLALFAVVFFRIIHDRCAGV